MKKDISFYLRWIAVLPASFATLFIVYALSVLGNRLLAYGVMNEFMIEVVASATSSMAFIAAGWAVAPAGRNIVSIVLCTLYNIIIILSMILSFTMYEDMTLFKQIILMIINIVASIYICKELYKYNEETIQE